MIAADARSQMLFEMGQCAYRLGRLFGAAAERAETLAERIEYFQLFDRCGFAVRMSVALELRLRREARAEGRALFAEARERDPAEGDAAETEAAETGTRIETYAETEADRERETASLPLLLSTLDHVVADAASLPGPPPAVLPTLRELLARVKSETAPAASVAARPPTGGGLRTRLAASATAPTLGAFALSATARAHPFGRASPRSRATGPPR